MTIGPEELARRYCAVGHLVPQRAGAPMPCATHTILARGTWALIQPDEQPMGGLVVEELRAALDEANPPRGIPVAEGQVGMDEVPLPPFLQERAAGPVAAAGLDAAALAAHAAIPVPPVASYSSSSNAAALPVAGSSAALEAALGQEDPTFAVDVPGPADTGPVGDGITPPADRRASIDRQLEDLGLPPHG